MQSANFSNGLNSSRKRAGVKRKREIYSADFETITDPNDCRVWLWGIAPIDDPHDLSWGTDIDTFIEWVSTHNTCIYFHNLKFDGHFIMDWLLNNGFVHIAGSKKMRNKSFTTLISDMNKVYSITIKWEDGHTSELRDSLKKIPMSVSNVAKAFDLETTKGEIDYHASRPIGYQPTEEELDYLQRDVAIVAEALNQVINSGMTRLTVASDSLAEYKRLFGVKMFDRTFPVLSDEMDAEIRRAYRGGFTYSDERFRGHVTGGGLVLDVNSLYPSVMYNAVLPYGEPEFQHGRVIPDAMHPLTIMSITFIAKLKPGHIPCIQIKGSAIFGATDYLTEIKEPTTLMVTNVDLDLYMEHYDMQILEYGGGWKFRATVGLFDKYIDKWSEVKMNSVGGQREIAKLHLNSLYGKFASNPNVTGKIPVLDDGRVRFVRGEDERRPPVYTAVGVFVTSYARDLTIRAAQANYDVFAYADTDSLHLLTPDVPDSIDLDPVRMGAWKLEYKFDAAYFIRAKAYLERKHDGAYKVAFAGLPESVSSMLTFDDLEDGRVLWGKLSPRSVPGGVVLEDVPYTLKL